MLAGGLQYTLDSTQSRHGQASDVREGRILLCIFTWPLAFAQGNIIPITLRPVVARVTAQISLYSLFILFLISIPAWAITSVPFLIAGSIITGSYVSFWFIAVGLGMCVWLALPILNLIIVIPATLMLAIIWIIWSPLLNLFLPKHNQYK